jgi:diguanylate cyclase
MKQQFVNDGPNKAMTAGRSSIASQDSATQRTVDYQPVSSSTQQQIKLLASSNACLRRNLVRFSHGLKQVGLLAYHDELTGLPNRSLLLDRLRQAMQQAIRQQKLVLLLFVDLDDFKWVNDNLGVAVGDSLLKQVALRLVASIRGADTACRYGGDEFVLMLPEIDGKQSAAAALQKIRAQLAVPYAIDDRMITLRASIGVILYRGGELSCEDLIQQADSNMHQHRAQIITPTISVL